MRNKGKALQKLDDAENMLILCISGLEKRAMTAAEMKDKLKIIKTKVQESIVFINTNNETP